MVFLDHLLKADLFGQAMDGLPCEFRDEQQSGLVVEFICWRLFGRPFRPPAAVFHTVGRVEKWSGKRCLSA